MALIITPSLTLPDHEIQLVAIRAQGAGGQNVNKVASAIHLRFNILQSSLPQIIKDRLFRLRDHRITESGEIIIKAQQHRTQEKNRADALARLAEIIRQGTITPKKRTPTRPSKNSRKKRIDSKTRRGRVKTLRKKVQDH